MHPVVSDQPYKFVPPYHGRVWPWLLQKLVRLQMRKYYGIEKLEYQGLENLRGSLRAGDSILLAPNHCRPFDPSVITEMCRCAGVAPFAMASWHVFRQSKLQQFILRRIGAFSVYREGLDRQALQAGIEILEQANRPLVVFPEGVVSRSNDRLLALMEGVSFIARSAAKKRSSSKNPGRVVVLPVAIRYHFHGDIDAALNETLDSIEQRLSWRPRHNPDRIARIFRVGQALLWLKEIEHFGSPQTGEIATRVELLIDHILKPLEEEWLDGKTEPNTVARVKSLRIAVLRDMIADTIDEEERKRRWGQLSDMYIAQQMSHYAPGYLDSNPSTERLLETVEKFEEDLTDESRIHRPMSATVHIGTPIEVSPKRERGVKEDPVMTSLNQQLHELLGLDLTGDETSDEPNGAINNVADQNGEAVEPSEQLKTR